MKSQHDLSMPNHDPILKNRRRPPLIAMGTAWTLALCGACSVDFDGFVYNDDQFKDAQDNLGGSPGDGDTGGDGDTDTGDEPSSFCLQLCDDSEELCPYGTDLGYKDRNECLSVCKGLPVSALECRLVELLSADEDPETHCPATLEDGGGVCEALDPCYGFCNDASEICRFGEEGGYADEADCLDSCSQYDEKQLKCRITHLGFAADKDGKDAKTHCPHTLLDGGGVCDPPE